jgi:predicted O-methyltransferase YrrM
MNAISTDKIKELIVQAKSMANSGHPYLDKRWNSDIRYQRPYYRFCMLLAREVKPSIIVELGIDTGMCCGHWAFGCPTANVYGIDVHKDGEEPSIKCVQMAEQFSNFHYLRGWTWDKVKNIAALNKPIDVLYIDSWHEFDYFARDWNDYAPYINKSTIVMVDDLHMVGPAYRALPGVKYVDTSMNPTIPLGFILEPDNSYRFEHKHRDYMP